MLNAIDNMRGDISLVLLLFFPICQSTTMIQSKGLPFFLCSHWSLEFIACCLLGFGTLLDLNKLIFRHLRAGNLHRYIITRHILLFFYDCKFSIWLLHIVVIIIIIIKLLLLVVVLFTYWNSKDSEKLNIWPPNESLQPWTSLFF